MHDKHNDEQIFETLKNHSPNATILRLPKGDTLVVEAGDAVITIDGQGNIHLASHHEISVTTGLSMSLSARQDPSFAASGVCAHTRLQYDVWKAPERELTEPASAFESCSTGGEAESPSS